MLTQAPPSAQAKIWANTCGEIKAQRPMLMASHLHTMSSRRTNGASLKDALAIFADSCVSLTC